MRTLLLAAITTATLASAGTAGAQTVHRGVSWVPQGQPAMPAPQPAGPPMQMPAPMPRPGMQPMPQPGMRPAPMPRPGMQPPVRQPGWMNTRGGVRPQPGQPQPGARWGNQVQGRWYAGWQAPGGWNAYHRPTRGWRLPSYWIAPSFVIGDYAAYGLASPPYGYSWSRYYDDAVLVDGRGQVWDSATGIDWDRSASYGYDDGYAGADQGYGYAEGGYAGDQGYAGQGYAGQGYPGAGYAPPRSQNNGVAGALIGAGVGGVAGNLIAGRGNRLGGTLIGAGVGAIAGAAIGSASDRRRPPTSGAPYPPPGAYPAPQGYPAPGAYPPPPPVPSGYGSDAMRDTYVSGGGTTVVHTGSVAGGYYYPPATTTVVTIMSQPVVTTTTTEYVTEHVYARKAVRKKVYRPRPRPVCGCRYR